MRNERQLRNAAPPEARRSEHGGVDLPLPESFYSRPASTVAAELLGCTLVSEVDGVRCTAEIVETEAYMGLDDEASHSHRRFGITARNEVMFGPPGRAYVYRSYGIHNCVNAVTGQRGEPSAVLIRAARPLEGIEQMRLRRPGRPDRDLLRGPGNLCRGLAVDLALNRHDLRSPPFSIVAGARIPADRIVTGPRIGISRAKEMPLRFWVRGSIWVSG